jgi:hypothetical protein
MFTWHRLIVRDVIQDDDEEYVPSTGGTSPLRAYQLEADSTHRPESGIVFIAGPGIHLRRLLIDELLVRDWIRDNRRAIESTKAYWTNKQSPPQVQVMLVLQECRSNTWARISYSDSAELNNIKVALV